MKKLLVGLVLVLILSILTVLNVYALPLATTKLSWIPPTSTADGTPLIGDYALTGYKFYCGASAGNYTVTKNIANVVEYLAKDVPLTVGTWYCVITAVNQYGESAYSNEEQFTLEGSVPNPPVLVISVP